MSLTKFLAGQLSHPSGLFGKLVLPRLWNKRNRNLNDIALAHLALTPSDRVLEIGFGGGYLIERIAGVTTAGFVAGVDVSAMMVTFCQKRYPALFEAGKLDLRCAPAESLPFPDGRFTKICSVNSIFYWQNPIQAFAEIRRVLADEGLLVLCFTAKESLENKGFAQQDRLTLYQAGDVQQMMVAAGFDQISSHQSTDKYRVFFCVVGKKGTYSAGAIP
ncbi:MAG: methyltransferase domain-containing protein [Anaerolineae bacterium]|nr:methyltransferase domain-containing protein [Anaerolineae bacterium]